jgi:hypothetical protein
MNDNEVYYNCFFLQNILEKCNNNSKGLTLARLEKKYIDGLLNILEGDKGTKKVELIEKLSEVTPTSIFKISKEEASYLLVLAEAYKKEYQEETYIDETIPWNSAPFA